MTQSESAVVIPEHAKCLYHENCDLPAGHQKCVFCGKGKGGVCGACHCPHTLHVDVTIAEKKLEAARNRIEDDSNSADNMLASLIATEAQLALVTDLRDTNLRLYKTECERHRKTIVQWEKTEAQLASVIGERDQLRADAALKTPCSKE